MGCHPLSVLTALTVQDTSGVEGLMAIASDWVADQARALLEDIPVDAFKIGVLGSVENIAAIAEIISDYPDVPLILDPVLASGRGDELASDEMAHAMRELLLPQTTILTPNSMEARRLADIEDDDEPTLHACAARLVEAGCEYVLVTGTHEATVQVVNTLYSKSGIVRRHGRDCLIDTTGRAARWHPRSRRCSPRSLAIPRRSAKRGLRGTRSRKRIDPAWASIFPIACAWAREDGDAPETDTPESLAADAAESARRTDARGTH
jgi:hydroxymethylpyrimidine kinase/phosphomethylpyrimidine kinase